jgi:hypothetical protein
VEVAGALVATGALAVVLLVAAHPPTAATMRIPANAVTQERVFV